MPPLRGTECDRSGAGGRCQDASPLQPVKIRHAQRDASLTISRPTAGHGPIHNLTESMSHVCLFIPQVAMKKGTSTSRGTQGPSPSPAGSTRLDALTTTWRCGSPMDTTAPPRRLDAPTKRTSIRQWTLNHVYRHFKKRNQQIQHVSCKRREDTERKAGSKKENIFILMIKTIKKNTNYAKQWRYAWGDPDWSSKSGYQWILNSNWLFNQTQHHVVLPESQSQTPSLQISPQAAGAAQIRETNPENIQLLQVFSTRTTESHGDLEKNRPLMENHCKRYWAMIRSITSCSLLQLDVL